MSSETNKEKISVNQLKERFLECGICQEEFNEGSKSPRLLPCLHTFCTECLRKLVKANSIECPLCRNKQQLKSTKDVEEYPKDNTRRDLLQFVGEEDQNIICKACDDKSRAKYRCRNCADFLCEQCYKAHRRTKYTKEHKVFRIEELKSDPELLKEFKYEGFCTVPGHETVPLKLYCSAVECCKPICYNCAVSDHRDPKIHPVHNIAEVYENKKQNLEQNLRGVQTTRQEMLEKKEQVDKEINKVQPSLARVESEIDEAFGACIKLLEMRKNQIKNDARQIMSKKKSKLDNQRRSYCGYIERLEEGIRFTEETLIYKDVSGLLEIEETINKRLKNLQEEKLVDEPQTNAELQFQKTKMSADFESFSSRMGCILSTEAYPPHTKIDIPKQVQKGKDTTINISLHTAMMEPVINNDIGLEVELTNSDGNQEKLTVSCQKDHYCVQFKPTAAGLYHLSIRALSGKLLLGRTEIDVQNNPDVKQTEDIQPEDGGNNVFDVIINGEREIGYIVITYTCQGSELDYTQRTHTKCTDCESILTLLRRANEKGLLFQKTGDNKITWNKDIPFKT